MEQIFKVGKLEKIDNIDLKVSSSSYTISGFNDGKLINTEEKKCLEFEIGNEDTGFSFYSTISPEEFLKIEMNKRVNFREYINFDDFDFGVGGKPQMIDNIDVKIIHYLDKKFMLVLFIASDSVASHIQIDFDISEFLD